MTPGTGKVRSYDLEGNLLWSLSGMSSITIATPQADSELLYISSGYVGDALRPIYAIRPGVQGDISLEGDRLLIRTTARVYCIRSAGQATD